MPRYEYKVLPAPAKGRKAKGLKSPESRFALAVETTLNEMGAEGWEYLRAELLPSDERSGLTGSTVNWRNVLVFRRPLEAATESFAPRRIETPEMPPVTEPQLRAGETPAPVAAPATDEDAQDAGLTASSDPAIGAALTTRARLAGVRRDED